MDEKNIQVLIKIETLEQALKLFEEFFSMNQNSQAESVMKIIKILLEDLENTLWKEEDYIRKG